MTRSARGARGEGLQLTDGKTFSMNGLPQANIQRKIIKIAINRQFYASSDVICFQSGEFVVTDKNGLHLFDSQLSYKKTLAPSLVFGEVFGVKLDSPYLKCVSCCGKLFYHI